MFVSEDRDVCLPVNLQLLCLCFDIFPLFHFIHCVRARYECTLCVRAVRSRYACMLCVHVRSARYAVCAHCTPTKHSAGVNNDGAVRVRQLQYNYTAMGAIPRPIIIWAG